MEEVQNNTTNQPPQAPPQINVQPLPVNQQTNNSEQTSTIVTIILLIFTFPIGFIVMWFWPKWKVWVKLLVTGCGCIPIIILFFVFFAAGLLATINPSAQFKKADCVNNCETSQNKESCISSCNTDSSTSGEEVTPTTPPYQTQ